MISEKNIYNNICSSLGIDSEGFDAEDVIVVPFSSNESVPWNKGKKGMQVAWNKGLSKETNIIIDQYAKNLKEKYKNKKISIWNTGKNLSEEDKQKKSIAAKEYYKNNPGKFTGKTHSQEERKRISERNEKTYRIVYPDGKIDIIKNLKNYCEINNLCYPRMCSLATKKLKNYKNILCEKI